MAGTITHNWNGTVLTITSDAGTSSADLGGATGCRGPQGRPGVVYDASGRIIVEDLASKEYVDEGLNNIDNMTLIRDKYGRLCSSIGGYIISHVDGYLLKASDNVMSIPSNTEEFGQTVWVNPNNFSVIRDLIEGQSYHYVITLADGTVTRLNNVKKVTNEWQTIENNEYFSGLLITTTQNRLLLRPVDYPDWTSIDDISRIEVWTTGNTVYSPIDPYAVPIDNDTLVINALNQLTTGANIATHAYVADIQSAMETYVRNQIDLAQIGGDNPSSVLSNYYTKAEVEALIDEKLAEITNGEEVDY
jgi:hypothetical protein